MTSRLLLAMTSFKSLNTITLSQSPCHTQSPCHRRPFHAAISLTNLRSYHRGRLFVLSFVLKYRLLISDVQFICVAVPPMLSDHSLFVASFELIDRCAVENSTSKRRPCRSFDYDASVIELQESDTQARTEFVKMQHPFICSTNMHHCEMLEPGHTLQHRSSTWNTATLRSNTGNSRKLIGVDRSRREEMSGRFTLSSRKYCTS